MGTKWKCENVAQLSLKNNVNRCYIVEDAIQFECRLLVMATTIWIR